MSQKDKTFQSKSKKFGGGKGHGFGGEKRGFGNKFEGDRGAPRGDRPRRDGDKPFGARRGFEGGENRKPRFDRSEGGGGDRPYKPRREGGFKPRFDRDGEGSGERRSFKPRGEGGFSRDRGGDRGDRPYKPRREGGFKSDREGGFKPRFDRDGEGSGERRSFKPRGEGGFSRDRGGDRGDRPYKPRGEGGFKPRREGGFKQGREGGFKSDRDGGFKPRFNRDGDSRGRDSAPRFEARAETKQKLKSDRPSYGAPSSAYLFGVHAVTAALSNPKRLVQRLLVTEEGLEQIKEAYDESVAAGYTRPEPIIVEREDIERLLPRDAVHQGILLDVQPLEDVFLVDIVNGLKDDATVLVLDQVTDPHNVGAILRSAAAMGAAAVVMQKLHAPDVTGTLAKIASGAAEVVPVVREVNLTRALEQLKEAGFFCIGLDEEGDETLANTLPEGGKVALVLGAEGDGIRRLVSETCDALARLPTEGPIASLNVSNAAAIALYERVRARKGD
jgi:23S rRNA (guanosine2251-2'-O)-methyltransferase